MSVALLLPALGSVLPAATAMVAVLSSVPVAAGKESPDPETWVDWAEQFVAVMAVVYVSQYFVRMRRLGRFPLGVPECVLESVKDIGG